MAGSAQRREKIKYIFIITMVFIVACIETDMYLPSLSDMMKHFHTSEAVIQSLLSWNFIGICISGPFYGPLSDSFGRKKLLVFAMGVFLLGSLGTVIAQNIQSMLFWRALQGLGCGGCFTIGTTIIYDKFKHDDATKMINDLNCVIPVIMAMAPMLGGYINLHYGFRANFFTIAVLSLISFIICGFSLKESLPVENRQSFNFKRVGSDFLKAMKSFRFWAPTIIVSLIFAGYLCYISYISILFIDNFGVKPSVFPLYQSSVLISFVCASLTANRMLSKYGVQRLKYYGLSFLSLGGGVFITSGFLLPNTYQLFHLGMIVYSFGAGWLIGPYFTEGMEALPDIKGITASLVTSFRLLFTACFIWLVSSHFDGSVIPLVESFMALFLIGFIVNIAYERCTLKQANG